jgi:tetratricopeptide (TPR) repeat protein
MVVSEASRVSTELANSVLKARSLESFLRRRGDAFDWQSMAALKAEVDRLVGKDLIAAGRLAGRIEQLASLSGKSLFKAFADASRARVAHLSGEHVRANRLYGNSVAALRAAKLPKEAAAIQTQQVDVLVLLGRFTQALRLAQSARRGLDRHPVDMAKLETNIGNIYYQLDRYGQALLHYNRARRMLAARGDPTMRARVDFNRSNVMVELDRSSEALALLKRVIGAYDRAGQSLMSAQAQFHVAYLEFLRGNYNTALQSYYRVRDQLARQGVAQLVAWCNLELAEILLALNSFQEAEESAGRAESGFKDLGIEYEGARAVLVRALARIGLGDFARARVDLMESRRLYVRVRNSTFVAMADCHLAELALRRGAIGEAVQRGNAARRVFSRQGLKTRAALCSMVAARALYQRSDLAPALKLARGALRSLKGVVSPSIAYRCHHLIGRIERDRGRRQHGLENLMRAVALLETMRGAIAPDEFKTSFLTDKIDVYEDAISACLDDSSERRLEEAFKLVESSKSRALADLLANYVRSRQGSAGGLGAKTSAKLSKLIRELNWYNSKAILEDEKGGQRNAEVASRCRKAVADCEKQIAQLFRRLEAEGSSFAELQQMPPATTSGLREALAQGESAVEYFMTGDRISAFVASRDGINLVKGFASKLEVENHLSAVRFQIDKFNLGSDYAGVHVGQLKRAIDEHLARLYELVFAPVEPMIDGERLVLIPHGSLHYVPFHALRSGDSYLVDRFEISYAPSAAVLRLCRNEVQPPTRGAEDSAAADLVAVGLPERETPAIRDEIRALQGLFPGAITLTGSDATGLNFINCASRARYLHVASHGYFRRDNPMFSFLKLADCQLNFYSLLDLKLQADLVTLSACHTGVNLVFPGDELHGLMRGFVYAGARSLVVSLWAVNDRSTAEFMTEMYTRLRAGMPKRAAVREAQLAIKSAYGHPYYWAPFVLMGNPV